MAGTILDGTAASGELTAVWSYYRLDLLHVQSHKRTHLGYVNKSISSLHTWYVPVSATGPATPAITLSDLDTVQSLPVAPVDPVEPRVP